MIERLKQLTREMQEKPRNLFAAGSSAGEGTIPAEPKPKKSTHFYCEDDSQLPCVTVCAPKGDCTCDCGAVRDALVAELEARQLSVTVGKAKVGCGGSCKSGPFLGFPQKGFFYRNVRPEAVPEIVEETFIKGHVLFPYLSLDPARSYRTDLIFEKDTGVLGSITENVCMVEVAKYFLDFEEGLSCGKCVPCRLGMKRLHESLERLTVGKGTERDLEQIQVLCEAMIDTPHCEFAMASSRPVLSAITYFMDEFKAHVERQECPAGVCKELVEIQKKMAKRRRKK